MPAPSSSVEHVATYKIKVGGAAIEQKIADTVREVRVVSSLASPDVCTFKVGFKVPRKPGAAHEIDSMPFAIGKELEIQLGDLEKRAPTTLFKGEITTLQPTFGAGGVQVLVRALDKAHRLFRGRHVKAYSNQTVSDIVKKVCGEAGLPVKTQASGSPLKYMLQSNETHWEFIHRLAARIGFEFVVLGGTAEFRPRKHEGPDVSLSYPKDIHHFSPALTATQQIGKVEVRSFDAKTKKEIVGTASAASVLSEFGITQKKIASAFPKADVLVATEPCESQDQAKKTAQALLDHMADHHAAADGVTTGNPAIKAGVTLKVDGVGKLFGGKLRVHTATHVLRGGGTYETHFSSAPATSIASMLGATGNGGGSGGGGDPFARGLAIGIVTNNQDPDKMGRVKVKFPTLGAEHESIWAPVVVPGAGKERGLMMLPIVDEQVLVAFEHEDITRPYVIGSLFNGKDTPGTELAAQDGSFGLRSDKKLISRAKEEIELEGGKTYTVKVKGDVAETFEAKLTTSVSGDVTLESKQGKLTIKAMQNIEIASSGGNVTISGNMIKLDAKAQLDLQSSGMTNVKGTMVNLG